MKTLTFAQINKIILEHKYILLRDSNNHLHGFNCEVGLLASKRTNYKPKDESLFYSFIPCSIHEYINYKNPYK